MESRSTQSMFSTSSWSLILMESSIQLDRIWETWRRKSPEKTRTRYCQEWCSSSLRPSRCWWSPAGSGSYPALPFVICLPSVQSPPSLPHRLSLLPKLHRHISLSGSFIWPPPRRWSKSFIRSICQFKPFHFPLSTVQPRVEINWICASKTEFSSDCSELVLGWHCLVVLSHK